MNKVAHIVGSSIGIVITIACLVAATVWGYRSRPTDAPCTALEYDITDSDERLYLSETELTALLQQTDLYPVGRKLNIVSLQRIENTILRHPMVRTAECYLTPRHIVRIRLTQRVPVLHVQTALENYYIDSDRKVMPSRNAIRDKVLLVTGTVGVQSAAGILADFAAWLDDEPYWKERIHHLELKSPQMVYVYYADNGKIEKAVLGSMHRYDRKLRKFRTFLQNRPPDVQEKNYTEYDLRFKGQVIGRY